MPMLTSLRLQVASRLLEWSAALQRLAPDPGAGKRTLLLFFHGYSLAHTLRPLVLRSLSPSILFFHCRYARDGVDGGAG